MGEVQRRNSHRLGDLRHAIIPGTSLADFLPFDKVPTQKAVAGRPPLSLRIRLGCLDSPTVPPLGVAKRRVAAADSDDTRQVRRFYRIR